MILNPSDLIDAVGDDPQFRRGEAPDPVQDDENVYYISTGARGVNYTLRVKYRDYIARGERIVRDRYVKNLGPNAEGAVRKAKDYTDKRIYWQPIETHGRAAARPTNLVKFGKYQGMTIDEVVEVDPGYVVWMVSKADEENSFLSKKKYNAFVRELRRVADEHPEVRRIITERREAYEAKKRGWEQEREEQERKRASRGHVGTVGERVEMVVKYLRSPYFEGQWGTTYIHTFEDDQDNILVWKTGTALGYYDEDGYWQSYEKGDRLKIRGTIKDHGEYRGEPQTAVTRVKVLGRAENSSVGKLKARLLR